MKRRFKKPDYRQFREKLQRLFLKTGKRLEQTPPLKELLLKLKKLRIAAFLLLGFLAADLAMQSVTAFFFSSKKGATRASSGHNNKPYIQARSQYETIPQKNLFCPGCPIPDMKALIVERPKDCSRAEQLNSGPQLIGTIVLSDPQFSVATLSGMGADDTIAVKVGDDTPRWGSVFEIRRTRVCFDSPDGILRYVELPEAKDIEFGQALPTARVSSGNENIEQTDDNEFAVKRSFLLESLDDTSILQSAQAEPYRENGKLVGFKIISVLPGSVFESLGITPNMVIRGINGEDITSLGQVTNIYSSAREMDEISIQVENNGRQETLNYKVR